MWTNLKSFNIDDHFRDLTKMVEIELIAEALTFKNQLTRISC